MIFSVFLTLYNLFIYLFFFIDFSNANIYTNRTHTCGQLRAEDSGKCVVLCGWLEFVRLNRFIILRDGYGSTQLIIAENASIIIIIFESVVKINYIYDLDTELSNFVKNLSLESVLMCYGNVKLRPVNEINNASYILQWKCIISKMNVFDGIIVLF